jgi:L-lactate dehydrogenase complex protein LldG
MSRDAILAQVRASLARDGSCDADRAAAAKRRLSSPSRSPLPLNAATGTRDVLLGRFRAALAAHGVTEIGVAAAADVPGAVATYLTERNLPLRVCTARDERIARMPWDRVSQVSLRRGMPNEEDGAALSHALAGVAETGTLVLDSGPDNPTSLALLAETHVIAVAVETIVGSYEDAFDLVRARFGRHALPRSLNFVTGASRTGDIGGRIVMGAHGPRRLAVVVYGSL